MNAAEALDAYLAHRERLRTLVSFDPVHKTIDLHTEARSQPYWIKWDRIDSEAKLVRWIYHLLEKPWFTKEHLLMLMVHWDDQMGSDGTTRLVGPL